MPTSAVAVAPGARGVGHLRRGQRVAGVRVVDGRGEDDAEHAAVGREQRAAGVAGPARSRTARRRRATTVWVLRKSGPLISPRSRTRAGPDVERPAAGVAHDDRVGAGVGRLSARTAAAPRAGPGRRARRCRPPGRRRPASRRTRSPPACTTGSVDAGEHVRVGHHPLGRVDEAGAVDLPGAGRRDAADLAPPSPAPWPTTGLFEQRRVGRGHVAHLGGRERVEDVGQPAPVDRLAQRVVDRPDAVGHRPVDRLHQRGLPHLAGHRRERRAGQRRGDHPGDQQHRGRGDDRAGDRVDHLGRLPGHPRAQRPAGRPGEDLAEQRPGEDDDQRGEHPGHASSRRSGRPPARTAGRRAPRRRGSPTIEVAETSSPCRKPERANSSASAISTRSTKDIGDQPAHRHRADLPELRRGSCTRRGSRPASAT